MGVSDMKSDAASPAVDPLLRQSMPRGGRTPKPTATAPTMTTHSNMIPVTRVTASFDSFFAAERDGLVRAISIVEGNPTAAADLVDEAMVRAYQRWSHVSQLDRPAGWVYRVALNLGRSRFRRLRLDVKYRLLLAGPAQSEATEEEFFARIDDSPLMSAVMNLPTKQRSVVVARVLLDYSEAEVATALDIPPGTVKSRLNRALTTLRRAVPELAPAVARYEPTNLQPQGTNS